MHLLELISAHPTTLLSGFGLGLSLIIAIGAQNAYVLRQGARREHLLAVLLVCILSDVALILAGVAGFGAVIEHAPWVVTVMRWFGVAFLVGYGLVAARRALRPAEQALTIDSTPPTWLNPHVYLDTVVLLGSVANTHGPDARWVFAIGACLGSILWFTALGYGARLLSRWLASPLAWRVLDGLIAAIMLALAVSLALSS